MSRVSKTSEWFVISLLVAASSMPWFALSRIAHAGDNSYLSRPFDQRTEFPNYFLPEAYRGLPPEKVPEAVVESSRKLMEDVLASVLRRIVMAVTPKGEISPRQLRFFPHLEKELKKMDAGVRLYASGGVVRSGLTYVYDEVQKAMRLDPAKDAQSVLKSMIESNEDIPAIQVRGVGSDFDVLVSGSNGKTNELQAFARQITDSAANGLSATELLKNKSLKNTFFPEADIRDYDTQIERSTRQGGSTPDYLALDVGAGKFKEPARFPRIVKDLVLGVYEFAPPAEGAQMEDVADSAIRGIRTRLEMPWLTLKDETHFRALLRQVHEDIKAKRLPSARAQSQFARGVRNSRNSGAHNRFYRAKPGSVDAEAIEIARSLSKDKPPFLPEFVDVSPLEARGADRGLNGLPEEALLDIDSFTKNHTHGGVLYHGTPSVEHALAIFRQGLFLSKSDQGTAVYGRGAYSSPSLETAQVYGRGGIVLKLEVKKDRRLNILDLGRKMSSQASRALEAIRKKAADTGRDFNEVLSREHGIDIIVNRHVLLQNSDAVRFPKGLAPILDSMHLRLLQIKKLGWEEARMIQDYARISRYSEELGETQKSGTFSDLAKVLDSLHEKISAIRTFKTKHLPWVETYLNAAQALEELGMSAKPIPTRLIPQVVRRLLDYRWHRSNESISTILPLLKRLDATDFSPKINPSGWNELAEVVRKAWQMGLLTKASDFPMNEAEFSAFYSQMRERFGGEMWDSVFLRNMHIAQGLSEGHVLREMTNVLEKVRLSEEISMVGDQMSKLPRSTRLKIFRQHIDRDGDPRRIGSGMQGFPWGDLRDDRETFETVLKAMTYGFEKDRVYNPIQESGLDAYRKQVPEVRRLILEKLLESKSVTEAVLQEWLPALRTNPPSVSKHHLNLWIEAALTHEFEEYYPHVMRQSRHFDQAVELLRWVDSPEDSRLFQILAKSPLDGLDRLLSKHEIFCRPSNACQDFLVRVVLRNEPTNLLGQQAGLTALKILKQSSWIDRKTVWKQIVLEPRRQFYENDQYISEALQQIMKSALEGESWARDLLREWTEDGKFSKKMRSDFATALGPEEKIRIRSSCSLWISELMGRLSK